MQFNITANVPFADGTFQAKLVIIGHTREDAKSITLFLFVREEQKTKIISFSYVPIVIKWHITECIQEII